MSSSDARLGDVREAIASGHGLFGKVSTSVAGAEKGLLVHNMSRPHHWGWVLVIGQDIYISFLRHRQFIGWFSLLHLLSNY